jgi:hypothetical protein
MRKLGKRGYFSKQLRFQKKERCGKSSIDPLRIYGRVRRVLIVNFKATFDQIVKSLKTQLSRALFTTGGITEYSPLPPPILVSRCQTFSGGAATGSKYSQPYTGATLPLRPVRFRVFFR